jgi:LDH2 family malate/lactate/ureidoglycolate dehydrogenase
MPLITAPALTSFCARLLTAAGVPDYKAGIAATSLVAANLRGVDSHGVQLLPFYLEQLEAGEMDAAVDGRIVSESGGCILYDGENGLGQWISEICTRHAVRLAREHGVSLVVARESNHFGAAAWWAQKMRAAGQIGVVVCNASCIVPPWQAKEPRVGTNPICMAVPGPWLLDMATTTVAAGKIFKAYINHQPEIPQGWAFDSAGVPTTNTEAAYLGLLHPLGGYKGSGLAMLVEMLTSVLGGGAMSSEIGGIRVRGRKVRVSQAFLAIDVARFLPEADFTSRVEKMVGLIKSAAPAPGYDEVLVAGDPEWRMEAARLRDGVPIEDGNWGKLRAAAEKLGVGPPPIQ